MAKQKIFIFVGILVVLLIAGIFYFLIKKDSAPIVEEVVPNTPLTQEEKNAKSIETLNSFQPPADLKSDIEAKQDLNRVAPPKDIKTRNEADSKQDLLNITQ